MNSIAAKGPLALAPHSVEVYFGTCTENNNSLGIHQATLNLQTGKLSEIGLAYKMPDPTFIEIHPNSKFLYAVSEQTPGYVYAFVIDPKTKKLRFLNKATSKGNGPCHLCISPNGRFLVVSNYINGSVGLIPININGRLAKCTSAHQHAGSSLHPSRQNGPHCHSANISPDGRFVYVADLGLDKLMIYELDHDSGKLMPNIQAEVSIKPGAGPRHLCFGANGKFLYVINELDSSILSFARATLSGVLSQLQIVSTLPKGFSGISYCAEIKIHPNGKFLYGSNRGHDSLAIYKISPKKGTLTLLGFELRGINTPRNFNIDPTGRYCVVANQAASTVQVFKINTKTGLLRPVKQTTRLHKPVCVRFLK